MLRAKIVGGFFALLLLFGVFLLPQLKAVGRSASAVKNNDTQRTPVLVELFTSEGCSDCPPADALLAKLDRSQPVPEAQLIVLSEHVDYWNYIGWKDPYSSHEYSLRQGAFAGHFGSGSVYTPQMVVDGHIELVGSDERGAIEAIQNALRAEKMPVALSSIRSEGNRIAMHVDVGPSPSGLAGRSGKILIAVADESDESNVVRGENAGRTLRHIAVVRDLSEVGTLDRSGKFSQDVAVNFNSGNKGNLRIVAFVQDPAQGTILGAGSARLSN
jgi:hypothetical protein